MLGLRIALMLVAGSASASLAAQVPTVVVQARAAGAVGERFDGYLGVPTTPSEALRKQIAAINIKRRALYSSLAGRRGVTPQEVGISAGCTLLTRVAVGENYLLSDGQWRSRAPGQAPPRPAYCG